MTDPCTRAAELRALRADLVSGQVPSRIRFDREEVAFFRADPAALDREIARLEAACARSQGRRSRYAVTPRLRRY